MDRSRGRDVADEAPEHPAADPEEQARPVFSPAALEEARRFFAFDLDYYTEGGHAFPKVKDHERHYREVTERRGRRPNQFFDPKYYRKTYREDLASWPGTLLDHFLEVGLERGFLPSPEVASGIARANLASAVEWVGYWLGKDGFLPLAREQRQWTAMPEPMLQQAQLARARRRVVNWVVPPFGKSGGGHTTISRCVRTLERLGWTSVLWIPDVDTDEELRAQQDAYIGNFPPTTVDFRRFSDGFHEVSHEILMATSWPTAYYVAENPHPNVRLYFVQDLEHLFNAPGAKTLAARKTYEMGFDYVCAGPWLEEFVSDGVAQHTSFELCAEPGHRAADPLLDERDVLAAIYVRSGTERRCSELMVAAANELANRSGQEVVVFGDDRLNLHLAPGVRNVGVLDRDGMAALFHRSRFGLVASATNYSLVPVEMAAAGCVVVQPYFESVQKTVVERGGHATEPTPAALVDFVREASEALDQQKFDGLRGDYMAFARGLSWEDEFEKVAAWLEQRVEAQPVDPPRVRKTVAVVVPTYYPSALFLEIVDAVASQTTSFDVVLQVIDSRRDGEVSPIVQKVAEEGFARVHAIDAATFQHGDSRSLAVDLVEADYYAYLTDDAVPANEYWLESLIAPMEVSEHVAFTFGRHVAHPNHHPLYDRELKRHFARLGERYGYLVSKADFAEELEDERFWVGLCFNSDNNAAYRGTVLRQVRFPSVAFAEDQALARDLLEAGYSRAFSPDAVVRHSHDYTEDLEQAAKRGAEECVASWHNFGVLPIPSAVVARQLVRRSRGIVTRDAAEIGLTSAQADAFIAARLSYLMGNWETGKAILRGEGPDRG